MAKQHRCGWATTELGIAYHDTEWGVPQHDDRVLFEFLILEGAKAGLRPIHDQLMERINAFGPFEVAPKKGYVSLRRKKQFATVGPATKSEVEIGLNAKDARAGAPFVRLPPGGMCQFKLRISSAEAIDAKLLAALRIAYDESG